MSGTVVELHAYRSARERKPLVAGLTDSEFQEIVRLSCAVPGGWYIERQEDRHGRTVVLLVPNHDDSDEQPGCAYVVSRVGWSIILSARHGGQNRRVAEFGQVCEAIGHVRRLLALAPH